LLSYVENLKTFRLTPFLKQTKSCYAALISVDLGLVWTFFWQSEILGLNLGQSGQLDVDMLQVQQSNLFIQNLWQDIDANCQLGLCQLSELGEFLAKVSVTSLEEQNLSQDLVGEGARHDKGRVASCASQVDETAVCKENDVVSVWHQETVDLWLDVGDGLGVLLQPGNVNLNVKVTNVCRG
jgi:hypothetical protein